MVRQEIQGPRAPGVRILRGVLLVVFGLLAMAEMVRREAMAPVAEAVVLAVVLRPAVVMETISAVAAVAVDLVAVPELRELEQPVVAVHLAYSFSSRAILEQFLC